MAGNNNLKITPEMLEGASRQISTIQKEEFDADVTEKVKELTKDPRYKDMPEEELIALARDHVQAEHRGKSFAYKLADGIVAAFFYTIRLMGEPMAAFAHGSEAARYDMNRLEPITKPDLSIILNAFHKKIIDSDIAYELGKYQGFNEETIDLIIDALRPVLDVSTIITLWHKGYYDVDRAEEALSKHGFSTHDAHALLMSSLRILDPSVIRELYLRKEIDESTHDELLSSHGYTDIDISRIKELYKVIPPIPDIIRMAVREAWDEGAIRLGGLDKELPFEASEWAEKMGLSPEWFRKYWISHWMIPSVLQGYEMLHRGVISKDELNTLMRALDIAPGWRDKLMAISYSPYTRVDVRRMFKEGVISREEVKRTYLDLGYDDEHAENLTKWTVKDALAEIRGLTRTQVLDLMTRQIINEETAKEWLSDLGYPEEIVDVIVSDAIYKREKKIKDRWITLCKKLYIKDIYDDNDVIDKLSAINMLSSEIADLLDQWALEKEAMKETLSWGQLRKLLEKRLIDKETFKEYMKKLKYDDKEIDLLYKLSGVEITPGAE